LVGADRLALAATPTFAVMALLTIVLDSDAAMLCGGGASSLTGMATMYLLMSAFHAGPWVRIMRRA
jgi:hypothetical protein